MNNKLQKGEIVFLWLLVIFSLFWLWQSMLVLLKDVGVATGGAFPVACSSIMLIMSLLSIWEVRHAEKPFEKGLAVLAKIKETVFWLLPRRVVLMMLYVLAYALLLKPIGFILSTFLFLSAGMITLHTKKPWKSLIISAAMVAAIYVIFQLVFKVRLP